MKHVIFIVTMLVAGVAAGVWFTHGCKETREAAIVVADAASVAAPPAIAAVVVPDAAPVEDLPPIDAAVAQALDECDEVSCVLDDYARPCCDRYRRPGTKHDVVADGAPLDLDRAMISDGVKSVKPRIVACAASTIHGKVKVRVRVAPSGAVSSVTVLATPDPSLGSCVHDVMNSILFKPTQNGGSFSYPFVF